VLIVVLFLADIAARLSTSAPATPAARTAARR
jgi:hypothetical protein